MLEIAIAACSDRGGRSANEDVLRAGSVSASRYLAVLADGAGGHARGAEAARRVVDHVERALAASAPDFAPAALTGALLTAHAELQRQQCAGATPKERLHATVVVLWLDAERKCVLWSHVGDSRLYRVRHGRIEQLTRDDSVVQRLRDGGALTAEQAADHPLKNQLLAALGMAEAIEPRVPGAAVPLCDGDAFLLCSDGWWGPLASDDITASLFDAATPGAWLDAMQRLIARRSNGAGQDNFSAVAVWAADLAETTRAMADDPATLPAVAARDAD